MKKIKNLFGLSLILSSLFAVSSPAFAHCEIPCGIYGDSLRITLMFEDITTIEKSMNQINELSKADEINYNQLVRWVVNKEEHAEKLQEIISQYFLNQRIKIVDVSNAESYSKYIKQLTLLHQLMVYAMKSKQTTDLQYIDKMRDTLHAFQHAYFE
jgi:nickel superoxide dismutase